MVKLDLLFHVKIYKLHSVIAPNYGIYWCLPILLSQVMQFNYSVSTTGKMEHK